MDHPTKAVLDIGSNSIRLMLTDGKKTEKRLRTTALGQRGADGNLRAEAMENSLRALAEFRDAAGSAELYAFATEAVRSAPNGGDFLRRCAELGVSVRVLSGAEEAAAGFYGAYTEGVCCVIDAGGASTEITVGDAAGLRYVKSIPVGARRYEKDQTAQIARDVLGYLGAERIPPFDSVLAIGGAATSYAAIAQGLEPYDPTRVDGYELKTATLRNLRERLQTMRADEMTAVRGLQAQRREIIAQSGAILEALAQFLNTDTLLVRDRDNTEGFLYMKETRLL